MSNKLIVDKLAPQKSIKFVFHLQFNQIVNLQYKTQTRRNKLEKEDCCTKELRKGSECK